MKITCKSLSQNKRTFLPQDWFPPKFLGSLFCQKCGFQDPEFKTLASIVAPSLCNYVTCCRALLLALKIISLILERSFYYGTCRSRTLSRSTVCSYIRLFQYESCSVPLVVIIVMHVAFFITFFLILSHNFFCFHCS